MSDKIKGGYYIKARCIQDSEIAHAPPHVREIWDWLLKEANHSDTKVCKRGQTIRTFRDIQDGLAWYAGWRKSSYSKDQCEKAMAWLRKATMIATEKTTRGMLITVLNYAKYQNPRNYENNNESNTIATEQQQHAATINKNDNNDKNDKKEESNNIASAARGEVIAEKLDDGGTAHYFDVDGKTINELFAVFFKVNPTINFANSTQREAAKFLYEKLGKEKTINMAEYAVSLFGVKYAPTVTNPLELKQNIAKIVSHWLKNNQPNVVEI